MADYLTRLAGRTLGLTPVAEPIRAPLFAPERTAATTAVPEELLEAPNALPSLPGNSARGQEPSAIGRENAGQPGPRLTSSGRQRDLAPRPLSGDEGNGDLGPSSADVSVSPSAAGNPPPAQQSGGSPAVILRPPSRAGMIAAAIWKGPGELPEETLLPPSAAPSHRELLPGSFDGPDGGLPEGRRLFSRQAGPAPPPGAFAAAGKDRRRAHSAVSEDGHRRGPEPTLPSSKSFQPPADLSDLPDGPGENRPSRAALPSPVMASAETLLVPLSATEILLPKQERLGPGRPPGESAPPRDQEAPPVIEITIGRVEVKAVYPPAPPARPREAVPVAPRLSLEEYLRNQNGGRR